MKIKRKRGQSAKSRVTNSTFMGEFSHANSNSYANIRETCGEMVPRSTHNSTRTTGNATGNMNFNLQMSASNNSFNTNIGVNARQFFSASSSGIPEIKSQSEQLSAFTNHESLK